MMSNTYIKTKTYEFHCREHFGYFLRKFFLNIIVDQYAAGSITSRVKVV